MNDLQIFNNKEFGELIAVEIDGEPWFVGKDVANAMGYQNGSRDINRHVDNEDRLSTRIEYAGQRREVTVINESGLYALIFGSKLDSAKRFKHWVTSEVLPAIRKTGTYTVPDMSKELQAIFVLDKRTVEMDKRMDRLEFDIPLYASESDELQKHIKRKVVSVLGGKKSNAYNDKSVRQKVFMDAYIRLRKEFGDRLSSYKAIQRKYLETAHKFIEEYEPTTYLRELINDTNNQINMEDM